MAEVRTPRRLVPRHSADRRNVHDTVPAHPVRIDVSLSARRPATATSPAREEWLGQVITRRDRKDILLLAVLEYTLADCIAAARDWCDEHADRLANLCRTALDCPPYEAQGSPDHSEVYLG